jgi:hypothetical protein
MRTGKGNAGKPHGPAVEVSDRSDADPGGGRVHYGTHHQEERTCFFTRTFISNSSSFKGGPCFQVCDRQAASVLFDAVAGPARATRSSSPIARR